MLTDRQIKLIVGSLLHDIGKVVYRSGDGRNHSASGCDYLKNDAKITDQEILHCVRYHHGKYLSNADIKEDDLAYITYFADNVAAFTDRREADASEGGFDKRIPLDSVFNILNGNNKKCHYAMQVLDPTKEINYPTEDAVVMDEHFYKEIVQNITDNLRGISLNEEYVNSLLTVMEANLTYIPSSTSKKELADISLFDHVKVTAAISSCVEQYLREQKIGDYKSILFVNAKASYAKPMFLLYSMDVSGIQSFIYSVAEEKALKGLRARSFYLEIMMEHIVDEVLERTSLSRANLIYLGGGHSYILLPNTKEIRLVVDAYEKEINKWLRETFDIDLYIACGYVPVSANTLRNEPKGSYENMYMTVSRILSQKKAHRYDADMIRELNHQTYKGERECKVCHRVKKLTDDKCPICNALEKIGATIMYADCFTILCQPEENALPLPNGRYLIMESKKELEKHMQETSYVRAYMKNDLYTGKHVTNKLWVGDYLPEKSQNTFEDMADKANGIKKIAVLRADVDNLGTTFVSGFRRGEDDRYETLSRTATLSRQLSLFFKGYINTILKNGEQSMFADAGARNVLIVYSGGDDVFLAGAWNEVISAFCDIRKELERFSLGSLTISGGISVYDPSYPINVMANETQMLEDLSKKIDNKNAITLWNEDHSYPWSEFLEKVIAEKMQMIDSYFTNNKNRGMSFLYHLTELLRENREQIHIARYVYLLSRMEPDEKSPATVKAEYRQFSEKMYLWSQNSKDRQELITAIYLYVYLHRTEEKGE